MEISGAWFDLVVLSPNRLKIPVSVLWPSANAVAGSILIFKLFHALEIFFIKVCGKFYLLVSGFFAGDYTKSSTLV